MTAFFFLESNSGSRWQGISASTEANAEGLDYTPYQMVHPQNHQEIDSHIMSIDMAKEISMIQRSEKGRQARQYFIQNEILQGL